MKQMQKNPKRIRPVRNGRFEWPMQMPTSEKYKNNPAGHYKQQYHIVEDKVVELKDLVVHRFKMGDVEDPDLYAAQPLLDWQHSESGKWVMEHAVEVPMWHRHQTPMDYDIGYAVTAKLTAQDATFFILKWGNEIDRTNRFQV